MNNGFRQKEDTYWEERAKEPIGVKFLKEEERSNRPMPSAEELNRIFKEIGVESRV